MSTPMSCVTRTRGKHLSLQLCPDLVWSTHWFISSLSAMQDQLPNPFWKTELVDGNEKLSCLWKSHLTETGGDICDREPQAHAAKEADEALCSFLLQNQFETLKIFHKHREDGMSTQGIEDSNIDQFIILAGVLTLFFTFQCVVHFLNKMSPGNQNTSEPKRLSRNSPIWYFRLAV